MKKKLFLNVGAVIAMGLASFGVAAQPAMARDGVWGRGYSDYGYRGDRGYRNRGYYAGDYGYRGYRGYRGNDYRYRGYRCRDSGAGGAILGAIAGGLLGHSVDRGRDRVAGTVVGAGAGALIGRSIDRSDGHRC